ncbi:MAG TPA: SDR family oxidoreductase [Acidimicrobiales bacterium]
MKETVDAIAAAGGPEAIDWVCDVTESAAINDMFYAVDRRYGMATVLVHCAGVARRQRSGE